MLNLCAGWRAFNNFESFEFNSEIDDFHQFIESWNSRLDLVNMFGATWGWTLIYVRWRSSDSILVVYMIIFKLYYIKGLGEGGGIRLPHPLVFLP